VFELIQGIWDIFDQVSLAVQARGDSNFLEDERHQATRDGGEVVTSREEYESDSTQRMDSKWR
jgi:hypothetical protein